MDDGPRLRLERTVHRGLVPPHARSTAHPCRHHAWMDIPGLTSWLELPDGYYRLEYDDRARQLRAGRVGSHRAKPRGHRRLARRHASTGARARRHHHHHPPHVGRGMPFSAPEEGMNRGFTSTLRRFDHAKPRVSRSITSPAIRRWSTLKTCSSWLNPPSPGRFWGNDDLDESTNRTFDISNPGTTSTTVRAARTHRPRPVFAFRARRHRACGQHHRPVGPLVDGDPEPMVSHGNRSAPPTSRPASTCGKSATSVALQKASASGRPASPTTWRT